MIGFYNYTVWLTYLSLISAGTGIMVTLHDHAHPFIGVFFLLVCGLCDAFDGKVARSKKNRTDIEKKYGIQIDSLADMVSFGVLPACIGSAMLRVIPQNIKEWGTTGAAKLLKSPNIWICYAIVILYILAALIRLAYFNVTEEERQKTEDGVRKYYEGLPVTASALIFPTVMLFQYLLPDDITSVYFIVMLITGLLFLSKIPVRKPSTKGILTFVGIGVAEFALLIVLWVYFGS